MKQHAVGSVRGLLDLFAEVAAGKGHDHHGQRRQKKRYTHVHGAPPFWKRGGVFRQACGHGEHRRHREYCRNEDAQRTSPTCSRIHVAHVPITSAPIVTLRAITKTTLFEQVPSPQKKGGSVT